VYSKTAGQQYREEYNAIQEFITRSEHRKRNLILLGDFNIDIDSGKPQSYSLLELCNNLELIDQTDRLNNTGPTWRGFGNRMASTSRIDYIFSNFSLGKTSNNVASTTSDHEIVVINGGPSTCPPPPSTKEHTSKWNNSILKSKEFKEKANKILLYGILQQRNIDDNNFNLPLLVLDDKDKPSSWKDKFLNLDDVDSIRIDSETCLIDLLDNIISDIKTVHDKLLKKRQNNSFAYKNKIFQQKYRILCNKVDTARGQDKEALIQQANELKSIRIKEIEQQKKEIHDYFSMMNTLNLGMSSSWNFVPFKNAKRGVKELELFVNGKKVQDDNEIIRLFKEHHSTKTTSLNLSSLIVPMHRITNTIKGMVDQIEILNEEHPELVDGENDLQNILEEVEGQGKLQVPAQGKVDKLLKLFGANMNDVFPSTFKDILPDFTSAEVKKVIEDFRDNCAPGPSSENKALFLFLVNRIPNILTAMFKQYLNIDLANDPIHSRILKRNIIMIPKKFTKKPTLNDYRPISLLEVRYKILSKLLMMKVNPEIQKIVPTHQFGFVPTRCMNTASETLLSLIDRISSNNETAQILSLDIKAAFDSIYADAVSEILKHLFSRELAGAFDNLTSKGVAAIAYAALLSEEFDIVKGAGQGDPSSSFKYLLVHSVFTFVLDRVVCGPKGFPIRLVNFDNKEFNIVSKAFADDTITPVRIVHPDQVDILLETFELLDKFLGLSLNKQKTKIITYQLFNNRIREKLLNLGQLVDSFQHLGLTICKTREKSARATFRVGIDALKKAANFYMQNNRVMTNMIHRSLIYKSIVSAKLNHIYRVFKPSLSELAEIEKTFQQSFFKYQWRGAIHGKNKIAKDFWHAPLRKGGLGIANPKDVAFRAAISGTIANFHYCCINQSSSLNNLTNAKNEVLALKEGSSATTSIIRALSKVGPISNDDEPHLRNFLRALESLGKEWRRISLVNSRYSDSVSITVDELMQASSANLDPLLTLGDAFNTKKSGLHGGRELTESNSLKFVRQVNPELAQKIHDLMNIVKVKEDFKINKSHPKANSPVLTSAFIFPKYKVFNKLHKQYNYTTFDNVQIKAFKTRERDNNERPRNYKLFEDNLERIIRTVPNLHLVDFYFQGTLRVLPSKRKLYRMKIPSDSTYDGNPNCIRCQVISDSPHEYVWCIGPTYAIYALNNLHTVRELIERDITTHDWEFQPRITKENTIQTQLDLIILQIKKTFFNAWKMKSFRIWTVDSLHAHFLRALKHVNEYLIGIKMDKTVRQFTMHTLNEAVDRANLLKEFYRISFNHLPIDAD
jgi:hypothetical protein